MNDEKIPTALVGAEPEKFTVRRRPKMGMSGAILLAAASALAMGGGSGDSVIYDRKRFDLLGLTGVGRGIDRDWTPLTTAETERKIDMARMEGEAERLAKAQARRERRADRIGKAVRA